MLPGKQTETGGVNMRDKFWLVSKLVQRWAATQQTGVGDTTLKRERGSTQGPQHITILFYTLSRRREKFSALVPYNGDDRL